MPIAIALGLLATVGASIAVAGALLLSGHVDDDVRQDAWDEQLRAAVRPLPSDLSLLARLRCRTRRWRARERVWVPPFNAKCPKCDKPVVAAPTSNRSRWNVMFAPRPDEELIACCGEHGRVPFNTVTIRRRQLEAETAYVFTGRRR